MDEGQTWERTAAVLLLALAAGACGGGQAGGQTGDEDALPHIRIPQPVGDVSCLQQEPPVVLFDLDDDRAGFTPRTALDLVTGSFRPSLTWHATPLQEWDAPREIMPPVPQTEPLELQVARAGEVRFIGPNTQTCGHLEIDVQVTVKTESGALNERFDAILRAYSNADAWLEFQLYSPAFEFDEPRAREDLPPLTVAPLSGALSIRMPLMYQPPGTPEEDVDDPASYSLSESAELAAVVATLVFHPSGVEGRLEAWMYGRQSGVLSLAQDLATIAP